MHAQLTVSVAALVAASAWAQPVEFKGIVPGVSTAADVLERYPGSRAYGDSIMAMYSSVRDARCGAQAAQQTECLQQTRELFALPGNYQAQWIAFDLMSKGGKVGAVIVRFNSNAYHMMRDAISAKYGAPSKVDLDAFRTRSGAEFTSEVARWQRQDGQIVVKQMSVRIDESLAEFSSPEMASKREEDRRRAVSEGAAKL